MQMVSASETWAAAAGHMTESDAAQGGEGVVASGKLNRKVGGGLGVTGPLAAG